MITVARLGTRNREDGVGGTTTGARATEALPHPAQLVLSPLPEWIVCQQSHAFISNPL
jgi:hypothetical protein